MSTSIKDTFFEECEELLEALIEGLSHIETQGADSETINAVFRSVHSIKGGAGAFGLDRLVAFAHAFETVLDRLRSNQLTVDDPLIHLFHRSGDQLNDLIEAARDDIDLPDDAEQSTLEQLKKYLPAEEDVEFSFDAVALDFDASGLATPSLNLETPTRHTFQIRFRPHPALYANGHEPLTFLDALAELGEMTVVLDHGKIPRLDSFDPDMPNLEWTARLETEEPETVIHELFEFVEGLCDLEISLDDAGLPEIDAVAEVDIAPIVDPAPAVQTVRTTEASKPAKGPKPTLRVDLDRVDRLINAVGELIINQAMIAQRIEELDLPSITHLTNELEAYKMLARDIQEGVMAIRAQPVKPLFQRMSRIVREAADATGKSAKLVTFGETTEVDKTFIERLADPLTHMIRNAVDHGLEDPDTRRQSGKVQTGTITLSASHRSGSVFIEISDDGAGLNRERIKQKALENGLIAEDAELTESEIDHLLFLPGFSTAGQVSNLSGRGVGMDVVKNAVQTLGGRVSITSTEGKGTSFSIVLPLTLAVMDGFVISVGSQMMVIPISSILETIQPNSSDIHVIGTNAEVVNIRGAYVPIVDVSQALGMECETFSKQPYILLLVAGEGNTLTALRVGAIHDQRQVVIKSLESNYSAIPGISAATILGDGKIALILDPEEIIRLCRTNTPSLPEPTWERRHA